MLGLTLRWVAVLLLAWGPAVAHETENKLGSPGFRPTSSQADAFVKAVDSASIAVFPTAVRNIGGETNHDRTSQMQIVRFLKDNGLGGGMILERTLDSGKLEGNSQWEAFQTGKDTLGKEVAKAKVQSDYALVVELLIHPDRSNEIAVWGIHCYVLDREGSNAFSFLLNSHHKMFVDAALKTQDRSAKGQEKLVAGAVRTALKALKQQIEEATLSDNVNGEDPEEILQRRVGTWITERTEKKAEWTPEEQTFKGEETTRWILDKTMQMHEGWSKPGDKKITGLLLYDKQEKVYRSWHFDNTGVFPRSETTGNYDDKTKTLHARSDLGNGNKLHAKLVFTNKERIDWTMVIRNNDGRLMMDVVGHLTRKK
jgi:hypothetical protein